MIEKLIFLNKLKFLSYEFDYSQNQYKSVSFFRRTNYSYLFWIELLKGFYDKNIRTVDQLILHLKRYGAATQTVINLIKLAESNGFLSRVKCNKDKRKTFVKPENITIQQFEDWSKHLVQGLNKNQ